MEAGIIARQFIEATYNPKHGIFFKAGKETMAMLGLMEIVVGHPLKNDLIFLDGGEEQKDLYKFIYGYAKERLVRYEFDGKRDKVRALKEAAEPYKFVYTAIRRDEHESRSNVDYIEVKENHVRLHPMLEFSEDDVWKVINKYDFPYPSLYDEGYRSLGGGARKSTDSERSGRKDEDIVKELREIGYF